MGSHNKKLPLRGHLLSRAGFRLWRLHGAIDAARAKVEAGANSRSEWLAVLRAGRLATWDTNRRQQGRRASSTSNEKRIASSKPVDRRNIRNALIAAGVTRQCIRLGRSYVPAVPGREKEQIGDVPPPDGPIFGREHEAADIAWRLGKGVLCLYGHAGIGKSHLARDIGSRLAGRRHQLFPGGVWWLDVQGATEPMVQGAGSTAVHPCLTPIWERLQADRAADGTAQSGRTLFIIDGADGLTASCEQLLKLCLEGSEVCLLFTARDALYGMPRYRLGALRDDVDGDLTRADLAQRLVRLPAVRLYVERVRRWHPTFAVTPEAAQQIHDECAACCGIPARLVARAEASIRSLQGTAVSDMAPPGQYVPRDAEEKAILDRLAQHRAQFNPAVGLLLSVEGDGGMGKTRLAREVWGQFALPEAALRAWVDFTQALTAETDASASLNDAFLRHLATAFPLLPSRDFATDLLAYLKDKAGLLVLDNLETVQCDLVEDFLRRLSEECPKLCIICTTRLSLARVAQAVIDLNGGMTPDEAVRLFVRRWREACSLAGEFQPIDQADVRAIVEASGRIPLAVELIASAGRTDTPPALLAAELQALRAEAANSPAFLRRFADPDSPVARRWSSVEASILWSYRHIRRWARAQDSEAVERAFAVCGLFAGPFLDEDFAAVAGSAKVHHLGALRAAHLVDRDPETGAWRQHVFLHEFARGLFDALPDAAILRDRHADHYWRRFQTNAKELARRKGATAQIAFAEPNWTQAGYRLLRRAAAGDETAARTFRDSGSGLRMYVWFGRWFPQPFLGDAAKLCRGYGDHWAEAHCVSGIASSLSQRGLSAEAEPVWQEAARLYESVDDRSYWVDAIRVLASIAHERGHYEEARNGYQKAIHLHGDRPGTAALYCIRDLANVEMCEGKLEEAETGFRAAMAGFVNAKLLHNVADCLVGLADISARRGEFHLERRLVKEALRMSREADDAFGTHCRLLRLADAGACAAQVAAGQDRRTRALRLSKVALARIEAAKDMNQQFGSRSMAEYISVLTERTNAVLRSLDAVT